MPLTLPGGRVVDLDPNPTGETQGIPSNVPIVHPPGWSDAYGGAPNVSDPIAAAWQALGGNVDLLPGLFSLGNAYNLFNYDQRMGQVQGTPGFGGVQANLAGQLPQDVINQLAQGAAQRGVMSGGAPDSPNTNAAYLRSLGLNSLQQQQLGQQQLNALLGQFQQAAPFNLMSGLVDADAMQAALQAANISGAAPNPKAAADEEQRKLLEAIEAGKRAAAAGGGPVGGGLDIQKILDAFKAANKANEPQTVVGSGPNQTVNRGVPDYVSNARTNYIDPGVAGRPNDAIKNASTYTSPLGGLGVDTVANAIGQRQRPEQRSDFGIYTTAAGPTYGNNPANAGYTQFGAPITSGGLSYDTNSHYPFDYTMDQNANVFGAPIQTGDLYTGKYSNYDFIAKALGLDASHYDWNTFSTLGGLPLNPEITALLSGLGGIGSNTFGHNLTQNDLSQFGNPITVGDLMSGGIGNLSGIGSVPAIEDVDFWLSQGD